MIELDRSEKEKSLDVKSKYFVDLNTDYAITLMNHGE